VSTTTEPSPARQQDRTTTRRRRWPRRLLVAAILALLAIVLVAAALIVYAVRAPFPDHDGELALPALDAPVEVTRDDFGVPTISATTSLDLFRAQGFAHAQDRFWQMDTSRHIATGRTAELFGPDSLPTDRFLRTLGWNRVAAAELELLDADTVAMLEAYAEGVNAYLEQTPQRRLGVAYPVLGLVNPDYEVEPWEPVHSVAFLKLMAWELRTNLNDEIDRAILARTLTAEQLAELYPGPPGDVPVIVEGTGQPSVPPPFDLSTEPASSAIDRLADAVAEVERTTGPSFDGFGSNSWVLGGDRTSSGLPILANDPHLGIQAPSLWYEVHLRCPTRDDACLDDVAGFSFPGVPGIVIGRNDRVAWGFTNLGADVTDLVVERVRDDAYERDGRWEPFEVVTETLRASDGTAEELQVRLTGNGPLVGDVFESLDDIAPDALALDAGDDYALALRWTALTPGRTMDALLRLGRARDFDDFREAARVFEVPSQNLVYADVDGGIGYQAPGKIPIRGAGDGRLPVPGWDSSYEWVDWIGFEDLPWFFHEDGGWIVTANNPVVGADYPNLLTTDWSYGHRARRIGDLIEAAGGDVTVDDVVAMQMDTYDTGAQKILAALLDVPADGDERVAEVQSVLGDWDLHADKDSAGAAAYQVTWARLLEQTFGPHLPEQVQPHGYGRWMTVVDGLLDEPDHAWWDDPRTTGTEDRDTMLHRSMAAAHDELTDTLGDADDWRWGDLHTATFRESTLGNSGIGPVERLFNRGPYRTGGGPDIVLATGSLAWQGYEVFAAPSTRMVFDLGDPDAGRTIHAPGQSGHPYHRNYVDMVEPWQRGGMRDAVWTAEAVESAGRDRQRLVP
jgi:penicillin G amidase